jgi:hypothetical protein
MMIGMCVVDMHRCYRYYKIKKMGEEHEDIDQIWITQFTNFICGEMDQWQYKQHHRPSPNSDQLLTRIYDSKTGQLPKPPNEKQRNKVRNVGNPVELTCFMCRHYRHINGNQIRRKTAFWCKTCHMPLCKTSRIDGNGGWTMTCLQEHRTTEEREFGCIGLHVRGSSVPTNMIESLYPPDPPLQTTIRGTNVENTTMRTTRNEQNTRLFTTPKRKLAPKRTGV